MITSNGEAFRLFTSRPGRECIDWRAESLNGKEICSGTTDLPEMPKEKKAFIEEVKNCVDYSLGWREY